MTALRGLLRKEFFHIRRDRRTATVLVAIPLVQVLIFGYAIRTDVDNVRLYWDHAAKTGFLTKPVQAKNWYSLEFAR